MECIDTFELTLALQVTDVALFENLSNRPRTGIALRVMDSPAGIRLFVVVATPETVVAAALDDNDASEFGMRLAQARLHLAAGDIGGSRN